MIRFVPILALVWSLAGCAGQDSVDNALSKPIVAKAGEPGYDRTTVLDWKGARMTVFDPGNTDFTREPTKVPKMPYMPVKEGPLSGTVFVLDPGHGGKDPGCYWIENFDGNNVAFWESAYSYAMLYTLTKRLREEGAIVYHTAHSDVAQQAAENQTSANDPLPVPRDAVLTWNGKSVEQGKPGWWNRIHMINDVYKRYKGTHKVVTLSLHVDSMPTEGWKGSHVLVKDKANPPKLAQKLATHIQRAGTAKSRYGEPKPLIDRTRDLFLFRKTKNPDTVLWEMAMPQDAEDSHLIRDRKAREEYAEVAVEAAKDFATE